MGDESQPTSIQTRTGHYFFVDIVGLSGEKVTDKQVKKIDFINEVVKKFKKNTSHTIFLTIPTGDGLAVDFDDPIGPIELALHLQDRLRTHNVSTKDPELKIQVRIGLNGGPVAIFRDSENRPNVWGEGIILARRIMDLGDEGHILMSKRTADDLKGFSDYSDSIKDLGNYPIKHGFIQVYSYYDEIYGNSKTPNKIEKALPTIDINEAIGDKESLAFLVVDRQIDESKKLTDLKNSIDKFSIDQIYLYWETSSADRWERLWANKKYTLHNVSLQVMLDFFPQMLDDIPNSMVFDFVNLGVGGGKKDTLVLETLLRRARGEKIRYYPLDQNYSMLSRSIQYVLSLISKEQYRKLELIAILGDFTKLERYNSIIYNKTTPKIFGLFGSLIGNVDEMTVLSGIRDFMRESDVFIIGADLIGGRTDEELEEPYKQPEVLDLIISPLIEHLSTDPDHKDFVEKLDNAKIGAKTENGWVVPGSKKVQVYFSVESKIFHHFFSTKYDLVELEKFLQKDIGFIILGKYTEMGKYERPEDVTRARYAKFVLKKP